LHGVVRTEGASLTGMYRWAIVIEWREGWEITKVMSDEGDGVHSVWFDTPFRSIFILRFLTSFGFIVRCRGLRVFKAGSLVLDVLLASSTRP